MRERFIGMVVDERSSAAGQQVRVEFTGMEVAGPNWEKPTFGLVAPSLFQR